MTETRGTGYQYVVTVIADDRPGLLAAVVTPLTAAGCVIETASVTPLDRVVGITLLVWVPSGAEPAVRSALVGLTVSENVKMHVDPVFDGGLYAPVTGELRMILLPRIPDSGNVPIVEAAVFLAQHGVAIRMAWPNSDSGVTIQAVIPPDTDEAELAEQIRRIGGEIRPS